MSIHCATVPSVILPDSHHHGGEIGESDDVVEVDASLIFSKRNLKLRTVDGSILLFNVDVYE